MYLDHSLRPRVDAPVDISISTGTCFFAADRPAASSFIPCGNAAVGHQSCCSAGDTCLSDGACWSQKFLLTYLAGCTDFTYGDKNCPNKFDQKDLPWTSIVRCNDVDGIWQTCPQRGAPLELAPAEPGCACSGDPKTNVFTHPGPTLDPLASLPTATGLPVSFAPGRTPSAVVRQTSPGGPLITFLVYASSAVEMGVKAINATAVPNSATPTRDPTTDIAFAPTAQVETSIPLPPTTPSSPVHSAVIIGGTVGGAFMFILLAMILLFMCRRREHKSAKASVESPPNSSSKPDPAATPSTAGPVFTPAELSISPAPAGVAATKGATPSIRSAQTDVSAIPPHAPTGASLDLPRKPRPFGLGINFPKSRHSEDTPRSNASPWAVPPPNSPRPSVDGGWSVHHRQLSDVTERNAPGIRDGTIRSELTVWRPRGVDVPADVASLYGARSVRSFRTGKGVTPSIRDMDIPEMPGSPVPPAPKPPAVPPKGLGPCYEMPV